MLLRVQNAVICFLAEDETYYPNEVELDEYVLNELSMMLKWHQKDAWLLGQFSTTCLATVLHLLQLCLEKNLLKMDELGCAAAIVQAMAMAVSVNSSLFANYRFHCYFPSKENQKKSRN